MDEKQSDTGGSSGPGMRTTGGGWRWTPPTPEELGELLPGYGLERLLGHGGMGAVYKGVQLSLDREVAIKILPPGMAVEDPGYAARFRNEARVMARLQHPGIVSVFESGETAEGQLYFVMEYVDGTDVHEMLRAAPGGRLAPEHALAICAHACDALGYAHQNGVIHRDIKPANILINRVGQVKVADFGLGKVEEPGASGLTQAGMAMGTPDYVAPEALIPGSSVDGRADVYALGVMMYQMLTGRVPRGAFQPASVAVPGLDRRLDGVISQAMQMEREDRYQTTDELRAELGPMLYGGTSAAELAGYSTSMIKRKAPGPGSGGASSGASAGSSASSGAATGARPAVAATRPAPAVSAAGGATPAKVFTWVGLGATAVALLLFLAFGMGGGKNGKEAKTPEPDLMGLGSFQLRGERCLRRRLEQVLQGSSPQPAGWRQGGRLFLVALVLTAGGCGAASRPGVDPESESQTTAAAATGLEVAADAAGDGEGLADSKAMIDLNNESRHRWAAEAFPAGPGGQCP